jgi:DNA-binding protein HU-beta
MTKADLVNEIAIATGYDKVTINVIVEASMKSIKKSLIKGESVFLRGFGTYLTKTRKEKVARNIGKHISVVVPEHRVVAFKPAASFAQEVRQ